MTRNVRLSSGLRLVNGFRTFEFSSIHFLADTLTLPLETVTLNLGILSNPGKSSMSPICKKKKIKHYPSLKLMVFDLLFTRFQVETSPVPRTSHYAIS